MIAFWILAPVMVAAALGILFVRKAVPAALLLAVVMVSIAVLYAVLEAPFLFAVQIIVYTGAILMLFLFVLMLVGVDASDSVVETIRGQRLLAILGGLLLGTVLVTALAQASSAPRPGWATSTARQRRGPREHPLLPLRLRLRGHLGAAHHGGHRCDGARPPGSGFRPRPASASWPSSGCVTTPSTASIPARCRPRCLRPAQRRRHRGAAARRYGGGVLGLARARGPRHRRSAPAEAENIEGIERQLGVGVAEAPRRPAAPTPGRAPHQLPARARPRGEERSQA
ncbi:MAG: NADH-quinone oxidoreductase subunit J [Nocardioides sp.]